MAVKRQYDGSRRKAATRATRRAVLDAAHRLFLELGYPATTMARIAEESQVPPATMYRLFGSKRSILKELLDVTLGGDDQAIEFQHRPEVRDAFADQSPGAMLDAFAHVLREMLERSGALQHILATSAVVDDEAAAMWEITCRQRYTGQGRIVRDLARRRALRRDLTQAQATDIVYTLMSPEVHRTLTVERGWTGAQYEAWLARTLRDQLLRAPRAPATRT